MSPPLLEHQMKIAGLESCPLCSLSPTRTHVIMGEGSLGSDIFLIAQAPGETEDMANKMFAGPSGMVFWELLDHIGADKGNLYITNLLKCRLPHNRHPKQAEIQICARYLETELGAVKPKIVAPLGYYATKYIFASRKLPAFKKAEYPSLIGKAYLCAEFFVIPLTHPTSLIHHPQYWQNAVDRYHRVFNLEPCKWLSVCPMRTLTISRIIDYHWTDEYCLGDWRGCKRYALESLGIPHSDFLLPDGSMLNPQTQSTTRKK